MGETILTRASRRRRKAKMMTDEERNALSKTMKDTILQNVPMAIEANTAEGEFVYRIDNDNDGNLKPFCLLTVQEDHLELRFPKIPDPEGLFDTVEGCLGCRLTIRKREDIPGVSLNEAIKTAAASK